MRCAPRGKAASLLIALAFLASAPASAGPDVATEAAMHDGTQAEIDLPLAYHQQNTGGSDGAGLCVFASLQMCSRWESIAALSGLFEYMKTQRGGGWPEKVERVLKHLAPDLAWVQYEGADPSILDAAMKTGRPVGVTYGYGDWYRGKVALDAGGKPRISHMVFLAHIDPRRAAIVDNNRPGVWTWMDRDEFLARWKYPSGSGWAVVLLGDPPPPVPSN